MDLAFKVNGEPQRLDVDPRTTLLDLLRERLALAGAKKGCDHGQCGACTVLVNGERINACLSLALMHEGDAIVTIEGLSPDGATAEALHPLQAAFLRRDAFQCGYCTPGQILSGVAVLAEARRGAASFVTPDLDPGPPGAPAGAALLDDEELRERMSGNLCRCSAYPNILQALRDVAQAEEAA